MSTQAEKTGIDEFMELAETWPVADVRSPSEFSRGHIPGAFNIPLFDNEQRALVGTVYKKEGREKAILRGIKLTGPYMHLKLKSALEVAADRKILVHCWRGGMRSEAMAWLFALGGLEPKILEGGYKQYRHHVISGLSESRKVIVLGGMTGSGKTRILRHLASLGEQIIDLEELACHKGSAFGSLGQPPQPSSEHFSNLLHRQWIKIKLSDPLWLEDESRNIGTVFMPDEFYRHIQTAPVVVLKMSIEKRVPWLIEEYAGYPVDQLIDSVLRISKRLGGDNTRDALDAIKSGDFSRAIRITLDYYDKTYLYSISKNHTGKVIWVETDTEDVKENAARVLEASQKVIA
jgi:tRNA 2-selenouridine synthase